MPTVFHHIKKLRIFGNDWFAYIAEPYTLAKAVEDPANIEKLANKSLQLEQKGLKSMSFN
jgi:hypothetical protein